jgi:hypothetical protein
MAGRRHAAASDSRPSIEQPAIWMAPIRCRYGPEAGHDEVVQFFGAAPGTFTGSPVGTRVALLRLIIQ